MLPLSLLASTLVPSGYAHSTCRPLRFVAGYNLLTLDPHRPISRSLILWPCSALRVGEKREGAASKRGEGRRDSALQIYPAPRGFGTGYQVEGKEGSRAGRGRARYSPPSESSPLLSHSLLIYGVDRYDQTTMLSSYHCRTCFIAPLTFPSRVFFS